MKKYLLSALFCVHLFAVYAQNNQWAWMGGENNYKLATYGIKGVADTFNRPGIRQGSANWKDASGNFWLMGGSGNTENSSGNLNDLWKFNPVAKLWTWIGGDSVAGQKAVYGTRGVASPANKPGAFSNPVSWTDAAGNFWLHTNILWKYNPSVNQWTWINGDTAATRATYGIKGVASAITQPGPGNSIEWTDASGNFWLYGNVLWKYNPVTDLWTWVHGDTVNTTTVYGVKGVPNMINTPGTRTGVTGWSDPSGKFWLFGGFGTVSTPYKFGLRSFNTGDLSDLWNYDPANNLWTWVSGDTVFYAGNSSGTVGTPSPGSRPGARSDAVSWADGSGNLWLFGGYTYTSFSMPNYNPYNDLWQYNIATNLWTYQKARSFYISQDTFSVKGIESPYTTPATRFRAVGWSDASGNLWLFGGTTIDYNASLQAFSLNSLLRYNPKTNLWALEQENKGFPLNGVYGQKGVADAVNIPGGNHNASVCTDSAGNVWLFGGEGFSNWGRFPKDLNDLWKRDTSNRWTWVSGVTTTVPPGRSNAAIWTDANDQLWMFGGSVTNFSPINDLWSFNKITNQWSQVSGSTAKNYGKKGLAAATNKPPARNNAITWSDQTGKFWLFGGDGTFTFGGATELNDLWNFDPATKQWTWVSGDSTRGQSGVYGNIGIPGASNKPGARQGAVSWLDTSGNMWMFGGFNNSARLIENTKGKYFNDLWKYNTATNVWTWMNGDSTLSIKGSFGTIGGPGIANKPGARHDGVTWTDASGNLWLFGGASGAGTDSTLNDLWRYDMAANVWTWVSGDSTINKNGASGSMGTFSPANKPGARSGSVAWRDKAGNLWLMGGQGYGVKGAGFLNDIWKFIPEPPAVPVKFDDFTASPQNNTVLLNWKTSAEQYCAYYAIQRSRDSTVFDSIGVVTASCTGAAVNNYSFTDNNPFSGVNYYRVRVINKDGSLVYTPARAVTIIPITGFNVAIGPNPVTTDLKLYIQSDQPVQLQMVIRNAAGHLLMRQDQQIAAGKVTNSVPVRQLAGGIYFITVKYGKTTITKKFFKQ